MKMGSSFMKQTLSHILNNYFSAKSTNFNGNSIADYIRATAIQNIESKASIDLNRFILKGSAGQGNWADIPWIALFDKDITNTATQGYYIVYLFCGDMSGVYISLNQGWTYFKEKYGAKKGKKKIQAVTNSWKSILSSTLTDFSFDPIHLKGISKSSDLAKGYELGHICGKFYETANLPNDTILIGDLRNLLSVYRELKGKLKDNSVEKTNNSLIINYDLGLLNDSDEENNIDDTIPDIENKSKLNIEGPPLSFSGNEDVSNDFNPKHIDFLKKAKNQRKLGYAGELMVLKYEREYLISNKLDKLAKNVKHVSKDNGDGAGYDILSFNTDGTEKYIEVKTTTGDKSTPFMISAKELKFSKVKKLNYYLYRVFEFDKEHLTGKLYILEGDLSDKLNLIPKQFVASGVVQTTSDGK
jgi:hypothetical protein